MILVLANLACESCGGESWSTLPLTVLLGPVECACCHEMAAWVKPGANPYSISGSSLEYRWYEHFPEAMNLPCR